MKNKVIVLFWGLLLVFAVPMASGGILLEQPKSIYNLGESLENSITLKPSSSVEDFLEVLIVCGSESVGIHKQFIRLESGEERVNGISAFLSKPVIGSLRGVCHLEAEYGSEKEASREFKITNLINIEPDLSKLKYRAGEELFVEGQTSRESGEVVNGFVELEIETLGVDISKTTSDGSFSIRLAFPGDAVSGKHLLRVRVFETDSRGEVSNEGIYEETIEIIPALSSLEILIPEKNIAPGGSLNYRVNAYDQAGSEMNKEVSLIIYEPGDFVFSEALSSSGMDESLELAKDYPPGYWRIEASADNGKFRVRKLFYVEEISEIQTSLIDDTLIAANIGNIPYKGSIEISIGSSTVVKQINLGVGESQKFRLFAPQGEYLIRVNDGSEEQNFGSVALTGNAIKVEDISAGVKLSLSNPSVWVLAAILVLLVILYIVIRSKQVKKKIPGKHEQPGTPPEKKDYTVSGEILHGRKENVGIVALTIDKDKEDNSDVQNALLAAKRSGAKIYVDGSFKIMLLAPSLTKRTDNEVMSVKIAQNLETALSRHRIGFGMGVNSGEIISEIKERQFVFTSVGNTISKAKKLASISRNKVLVSDEARLKVMSNVRLQRDETTGAWEVTRIVR